MMKRLLILVTTWMLASLAAGDVIVLKDGTRLEGDVKKTSGGWQVIGADGKVTEVSADTVKGLEVGVAGQKGTPQQAMSNLLSLRRSVEYVADLDQVINRYNRFIEQNKDTPAALEARKDLVIWQDRLDRGLVKLGTRWVTKEQRTEAANNALVVTEQARQSVVAGRLRDADPLLQQALDADPQCVPALYLRGVVLYQQSQIPASRKCFEAVAAIIADHAPTLNNLGVVLWRQNAVMPALNYFDQALIANPMNKVLLDNAAEVLAAVSEDQRKNPIAQRLYRRFTEQDTRFQEIMATNGWYRWGGTWIDRATMEHLKDIEKEVSAKLTTAKTDADAAQARLSSIDGEIDSIQRSMRQIEAQSWYRDPTDGHLIRLAYPPFYFEQQREEQKLRSERTVQSSKLDTARAQVRQLQAQFPKPKFTGVQQLIGPEGTPVMLPPTSATQPVTTLPATTQTTTTQSDAQQSASTQPTTSPTTAD